MICEDYPHRVRACFDRIHDGLVLPSEICDHLLQTMVAEGLDIDDRVAQAFSDPTRSKLRRLELRNAHIKVEGFKMLCKHNLRELRIHKCDDLSEEILAELNSHTDQLIGNFNFNSLARPFCTLNGNFLIKLKLKLVFLYRVVAGPSIVTGALSEHPSHLVARSGPASLG